MERSRVLQRVVEKSALRSRAAVARAAATRSEGGGGEGGGGGGETVARWVLRLAPTFSVPISVKHRTEDTERVGV